MYLQRAATDEIVRAVKGLGPGDGDSVAILVGEKNRPDIEELIKKLNEEEISFFGGIFTRLQNASYTKVGYQQRMRRCCNDGCNK